MTDSALTAQCRRAAARLLENNRWQLASADDLGFVASVETRLRKRWANAHVPAGVTEATIEAAVKNAYCHLLYEAFRSADQERQTKAMTEVLHYVYRGLLHKTNDPQLADDCAQHAVVKAWLKHDTVRDPGTFLYFVMQIGIRCVYDWIRANPPGGEDGDPSETEDDRNVEQEFAGLARPAEAEVDSKDWAERIRAAIFNCLPKPIEAQLIVGLFLENLSYLDLSRRWSLPPPRLQLLKFRALMKLSECPQLNDLWINWKESFNP